MTAAAKRPVPVPPLRTTRLVLRPLRLSDVPAIQALFPQWEVVRFLADRVPWPYPPDGALRFVRDLALPAMERGTEWHWSIRLRERPADLIGVVSLMDGPDDNRGFWLDPAQWGRGLATEAADVVTDFWFRILGRPVLRVPKADANVASCRVSERRGMRRIGTDERDYVSGRLTTGLWEIRCDEWSAR